MSGYSNSTYSIGGHEETERPKFWYFVCRHGDDRRLFPGTHEGFVRARELQDQCNGCDVETIIEHEYGDVDGSEESGRFSIDDGGSIELLEVEQL